MPEKNKVHCVITYTEGGMSVDVYNSHSDATEASDEIFKKYGHLDGFYSVEVLSTTVKG